MKRRAGYRAVYALSSKYKIAAMCRAIGLKRNTYYKWKKRTEKSKDKYYAELIGEIQKKTKQTYGYRRVKIAILREYGLVMNHKKVLRIMQKYNMLSQIRRKYLYKSSVGLRKYNNLLKRGFKAKGPNEKWCTDVSFISTPQGRLYLSCIKDCYDKSIIAYRYTTSMSMKLVLETVKAAVKKEKAEGTIIHSDRGFQYRSEEYYKLTQERGMRASMSRAGTPTDNAPIESFFSILKSECIYLEEPQTIEEAKECIDEFIDYYNNDRVQLKSKQTPKEVRQNFSLQASL